MYTNCNLRGDYSDITIVVNGQEFKCHKFILARCSEYFDTLFTCPFDTSSQDKVEIKDISLAAFRMFLRYAYGHISVTDVPHEDIMEMCELANYFLADNYDIAELSYSNMTKRNPFSRFFSSGTGTRGQETLTVDYIVSF